MRIKIDVEWSCGNMFPRLPNIFIWLFLPSWHYLGTKSKKWRSDCFEVENSFFIGKNNANQDRHSVVRRQRGCEVAKFPIFSMKRAKTVVFRAKKRRFNCCGIENFFLSIKTMRIKIVAVWYGGNVAARLPNFPFFSMKRAKTVVFRAKKWRFNCYEIEIFILSIKIMPTMIVMV